ncbi:MAG: response regulator transcription factor [Alphaproteobacteria bacterium]|nr:MAG: response regulator transcription factor [Alphaproteobacteria bacterium]
MEANVAPDQAVVPSRAGRGIRILLVWGVRFTGECLAELLERDPSVSVIGLCADLSEAVALSASMQPDIVLLDGRMPEGAAAARRALDEAPGMRIVVSSVRETEDDVVAWAEAGVIGYIPRTTPLADFVRLMMDIHSGEQVCSGRVAAGLLRRIATTKSHVHNLLGKLNAKRRTEIADYLRG